MIIKLNHEYMNAFKDYIQANPTSDDDYFLSEDLLEQFTLEENITYISLSNNKINGALSIMKSFGIRLRYAHVMHDDINLLKELHDVVLSHIPSYKVFLEEGSSYIKMFLALGLTFERTIYALRRDINDILTHPISKDYSLEALKLPEELQDFADVRNKAFYGLKGSVQRDISFYEKHMSGDDYLQEATLLLRHKGKAVGIIKASKEIENGQEQFYIGPVAVIPDYQGRGLGKYMLSEIIQIANKHDCVCYLSVNTDNSNALKLYTDLGFEKDKIVTGLV